MNYLPPGAQVLQVRQMYNPRAKIERSAVHERILAELARGMIPYLADGYQVTIKFEGFRELADPMAPIYKNPLDYIVIEGSIVFWRSGQ